MHLLLSFVFFFFQAEDGIRDLTVTGVQTCALPIYRLRQRRQPYACSRYGAAETDILEQGPGGANFPNFETASHRKYLTLVVWWSGEPGDCIRVYAPDSPFRISSFRRLRELADQRVAFQASPAVRIRCFAIDGSCVRRRPRVDGNSRQ